VTDRRATTFPGSSDRWANLEALGGAAGRRPTKAGTDGGDRQPGRMSPRRRRNLVRTLAIVVVVLLVRAPCTATATPTAWSPRASGRWPDCPRPVPAGR
jgi:hypothetical protein